MGNFFSLISVLPSPIIIVGCHRSGTSFLADKIKMNGVFIGNDLNDHSESKFFFYINEFVFKKANASWYDPVNLIDKLYNSNEFKEDVLYNIKREISSYRIWKYFGFYHLIKILLLGDKIKWGWKDPRNSITLSIWLYIFPNSKIIFVSRDRFLVAKSLQKRELKRSYKSLYKADPCKDFSYCLWLWEKYENNIESIVKNIHPSRVLRIDFDSLINDKNIDNQIKAFIEREIE